VISSVVCYVALPFNLMFQIRWEMQHGTRSSADAEGPRDAPLIR